MDMAATLLKNAEPFAQINNTSSTECLVWNLMKIDHAVLEKETFIDYTILYMYIAQGRNHPGGGIKFATFCMGRKSDLERADNCLASWKHA